MHLSKHIQYFARNQILTMHINPIQWIQFIETIKSCDVKSL